MSTRRCLHDLGGRDADEPQGDRQIDAHRIAGGETRLRERLLHGMPLARKHLAAGIEAVIGTCEILAKVRDAKGRPVTRATCDELWELRDLAGKCKLGGVERSEGS